ncbi:hypothetical protein F5Y07DRAFT_407386 [Xylaria sp. FL0933]|nr:hypothetical protein F5Y07DRAFT_407386 [Xylaria sp. FL0933]
MKLPSLIIVAYIGAAWALPQPPQTEGLIYVPCSSVTLFNAAYCCTRGLLGDVSDCTLPLLPLSDQNFVDQCTLFQKTAVCCIAPLLLQPPTLCIPLPASAT